MSSDTWGIVVLAVVIVCFILLFVRSVNKSMKKEEYEKKEFERIKDDLKKGLSEKQIAVVIRTVDGRQTDLESVIIENLISLGMKVFSVTSDAHREIWSGKLESALDTDFVLVGTMKTSTYEGATVYEYTVDMRVIVSKTKLILGACTVRSDKYELLSNKVSRMLSKIIQRQS